MQSFIFPSNCEQHQCQHPRLTLISVAQLAPAAADWCHKHKNNMAPPFLLSYSSSLCLLVDQTNFTAAYRHLLYVNVVLVIHLLLFCEVFKSFCSYPATSSWPRAAGVSRCVASHADMNRADSRPQWTVWSMHLGWIHTKTEMQHLPVDLYFWLLEIMFYIFDLLLRWSQSLPLHIQSSASLTTAWAVS